MTIPPERATTSLNEFGVTGKADGTSTDGRRADESAKAAKAKAAKAAKAKSAPQGRNKKAMGSAGKKPVEAQQQEEDR